MKIYCLPLVIFFTSLLSHQSIAQKKMINPRGCGTMEAIEMRAQKDPQYRARIQQGIEEYKTSIQNKSLSSTPYTTSLTGPVIIPVVIHIVLPDPFMVTDDDVNNFINRLNIDFSGLNADSTNAASFYNVRGHSRIRFALARRDPGGVYTTGIERRSGNGLFTNNEPQPLKQFANGGLDPWSFNDYYNIWIGVGDNGLLGISPEIGPGTAATDGVILDRSVFSNNPCYTISSLNLARTGVHEIAHNFGLYHIFSGGCNAINDFGQLTSATCALPVSLLSGADDTPAQSLPTSGCQSGIVESGCANTPFGKMYQNFMDYTSDSCYSLFTIGQVQRMEWVLENCRPGLLVTQGHIPPNNAPQLDAALTAIINPGGIEVLANACATYPLPVCEGPVTPKVRVTNRGLTQLSTVTVAMQLNGGNPVLKTFTVNLATGESTVLALSTISLITGTNNVKFYTTAPNAGSDQNLKNDTLTTSILINAAVQTPVVQGFETTLFPPAGWSLYNPDNNFTWTPASPGSHGSSTAIESNNFNNDAIGQIDDLRSMSIVTTGLDSLIISFDLAHKNYPGSPDQLSVLVSADCGQTFTTVFSKSGEALATAGSADIGYTSPAATDWQTQRIAVGGPLAGSDKLVVAFRNTNGYGNNIFIDSISITGKILPASLKQKGLVILPNPFRQQFAVWHYQPPTTLKAIAVYNGAGLLVWRKTYKGNADHYIPIDLQGKPAGLYVVKLYYEDAAMNISQAMIKN